MKLPLEGIRWLSIEVGTVSFIGSLLAIRFTAHAPRLWLGFIVSVVVGFIGWGLTRMYAWGMGYPHRRSWRASR